MRHDHLITVKETAERMHCTDQTVRKWMRQGIDGRRLDSVKVGKRWYTTDEALDAFINGARHRILVPADPNTEQQARRLGILS